MPGRTIPGQDPPPFSRSPHLEALERSAVALARRVPEEVPADLSEVLRAEAAVATLQLDGSPIEEPPERVVGAPAGSVASAPPTERGSWVDAFGLADLPDARITAREYRGARAAAEALDLAGALLSEPLDALADLHARATAGLVTPEHQGRWRRTRQVVHDASVGKVVLQVAEPEHVPDRMATLARWLRGSAEMPPLLLSGVLQEELLAIHPFESANGRVARAAARLVLHGGGLDPPGVVPVESVLVEDPGGYWREVAATQRRRDLTIWLERWAEAVTDALREVARRCGVEATSPPDRAVTFLAERYEDGFTIAEYRDTVGVDLDAARRDLSALLDDGRIRRVPGSRGLRFFAYGRRRRPEEG